MATRVLSLAVLALGFLCPVAKAQTTEWTWMGGSDTTNTAGVYPASPGLSTASTTNVPGSRYGAVSWTDKNGNLWLFSGQGYDSAGILGYLNDLWEFNSSTGAWAWMGGSSKVPNCAGFAGACGSSGVYGASQTFAAGNIPGSRLNAASWTDSNGNLWLFGGQGFDSANNFDDLNDLWEFNPTLGTSGEWAWMGGSSAFACTTYPANDTTCTSPSGVYGQMGTFAAGNIPAGRSGATSWTDKNGNFWLFSGSGEESYNDLWEFNPTLGAAGEWAWMSGSTSGNSTENYGTLGQPGGMPGGRSSGAGWTDGSGNLWLFGGNGFAYPVAGAGIDDRGGDLNDLWEYNLSTNQWTWMGGSDIYINFAPGPYGVYGTLGQPAAGNVPGGRDSMSAWKDSSGNFWLFGGNGYGAANSPGQGEPLNDLWEYSPATGQWTWMGGPNTVDCSGICYPPGVYGTLQTPSFANNPPGRLGSVSWTDKSGNFWLFGGTGDNYYLDTDLFGDLWESQSTTNSRPVTPAPSFSPAGGSYTSGQSVTITDSDPEAVIYISNSGTPTTASTIYSGAVPIQWSQTLQAVAQSTGYAPSPVATATYTLNMPAVATPALSLIGVGVYYSASEQDLELTDTTPGAQILCTYGPLTPYTQWNGCGPSTGAATLASGQTLYAMATENGYADSAITSVTYPLTLPVAATPTFSAASGTYTAIQSVSISDTTPGASIYYTLDGSTPAICVGIYCDTPGSATSFNPATMLYTGPVTVPQTMTLKAFAIAPGYAYSAAASASYTFNPANLGDVNIGSSASGPVIVVIPTAATLGSISVVTEGAANQDFTDAGGGTCTAGVSYTAMSACTVNVSFAPRYAGARYGAAVLYDASGTVIGTGYVQGAGQGPQILFSSSAIQPSIAVNGLTKPTAMTADTNGNLFVNDGDLYKDTLQPNGTYIQSTIAQPGSAGSSITVDGAGNLYDSLEYVMVSGSMVDSVSVERPTPSGGYSLEWGESGQAVDGAGNLYTSSGQYLFRPGAVNGYVLGRSFPNSTASSIAVDGYANWYFAGITYPPTYGLLYPPCFHANTYICPYLSIQEVFANQAGPSGGLQIEEELGANAVVGNVVIAVDRMGDAYFTALASGASQSGSQQLYLYRAALQPDGSYTYTSIGSGLVNPTALATDGLGNAYVLDAGATPSPVVYKFDFSGAPALSFANTGAGSTSTGNAQTVTVTNYGNMPLQLSGITVPADFSIDSSIANACTASTSLAALESCVLSISFTPTTALNGAQSIALSESISIASNTLNTASTTSTIAVTGTEVLPAAATPVISLAAGTYAPGQPVTISDTTPGATIYYAINGTPVAGTNPYNGAITVNTTETVEAIAVANSYTNSAPASAAYLIESPASLPTFSVAAGTYNSAQIVTLSDTTPGAILYYTTDGTTPTISSTQYYGAITVSSTETLAVMATADNYSQSAVATSAYTILAPNLAPIISSLSPAYDSAGGAAFTLTVNGTGFMNGSMLYWGTTALPTTYVSATQLTAAVTAAQIASAGQTSISVQTPAPGGGTSSALQFEVDSAESGATAPTLTVVTATVTGGAAASYTVTLPSTVESATASCLNLPAGALCSYSATTNALTITTSSTTPKGTYQITVVVTETVEGAAAGWILLPILLLPLMVLRKRLTARGAWMTAGLGLILLAGTAFCVTGCGGGGGGSAPPPPQTHQVVSSKIVTLTVQ